VTQPNERCYEDWAPADSPWSAWAKPVLFGQMDGLEFRSVATDGFAGRLPRFDRDVALVVDLEGSEAVRAGLELARRGWRPVPLFNATRGSKPLVDVFPTMTMLVAGGELIASTRIRPDAPPAFLIDARRMTGYPVPGTYDNRSIVLPQDFPSANLLRSRGINTAVLVREGTGRPQEDLSHVLLRWQRGGISLKAQNLNGEEDNLVVTPPSLFRRAWYRVIALLKLRRNNVGGFGALVPEASSGGYG
jgi:hypothetical protein